MDIVYSHIIRICSHGNRDIEIVIGIYHLLIGQYEFYSQLNRDVPV